MKQTVLANKGSIGVSFAGVTDEFRKIANIKMIVDRLLGYKTNEHDISHTLEKEGIQPTPANIEKVKAFFSPDHDWSEEPA